MSENDTLYQQLRGHMSQLKLTASAEALAGHLDTAQKSKPSYTQFLAELLDIEVKAGEQRAQASRLRLAGLPSQKTLEEFDFDAQPTLDRRLIEELATTRFVAEKANVLFIGPPGVGKTTLAVALALKAVHAGYRAYYTTAADLIDRTRQGRPPRPLAAHHALLERPSTPRDRRARLPADGRGGSGAPLPGHQPPLLGAAACSGPGAAVGKPANVATGERCDRSCSGRRHGAA
jgi:hypothetical protein